MTSLKDRRFRAVENSAAGQVDEATEFRFDQDGDIVSARYFGGMIRLGFLVGTFAEGRLTFRYAHVDRCGVVRSGESIDRLEKLPDGRLRLHESWVWHDGAGSGTSILEEVATDEAG